jgi:hypothetical protein
MILGNFQKKALGVALLILTFCIAVMSYANFKKQAIEFPPLINDCPDYFVYDPDATEGPQCTAKLGVYSATDSIPPLTLTGDYLPTNANSMCKKKAWAQANAVTWDGITNDISLSPCP